MTELTTDETTIITTLRARGETSGSGAAETVADLTPAERERIGRAAPSGNSSDSGGSGDPSSDSNNDGGLADRDPVPVDNGPTNQQEREPSDGLADPSSGSSSNNSSDSSNSREATTDAPDVPDSGSAGDSAGSDQPMSFLPGTTADDGGGDSGSDSLTNNTTLIVAGAIIVAAVIVSA